MKEFEYLEIPQDEDDPRFCQSFSVLESDNPKVEEFFDQYGFCVFRDVLSRDLCEETIDDMWKLVSECNPEVKRENPDTWYQGWSSFGMPKNKPTHPIFRPSFLRLRQHPSVFQCFASILKTDDIICSHDRCLMHRPTKIHGEWRKNWATRPNVHLDLNPAEFFDLQCEKEVDKRISSLRYSQRKNKSFISENNDVHSSMGRSVQGILNLRDLASNIQGGGTVVVPGSHRSLSKWWENESDKIRSIVVGPTQHLFGDEMLAFSQRVCMRAGSLLIWDQRLIHGSTSNSSSSFRYGIPIRFYPANQLLKHHSRAVDRACVLQKIIVEEGFENEVSDLGHRAFGLSMVKRHRGW